MIKIIIKSIYNVLGIQGIVGAVIIGFLYLHFIQPKNAKIHTLTKELQYKSDTLTSVRKNLTIVRDSLKDAKSDLALKDTLIIGSQKTMKELSVQIRDLRSMNFQLVSENTTLKAGQTFWVKPCLGKVKQLTEKEFKQKYID